MDIQLYYQEKGQGKPFFMLHGNGEDGNYFVHQIDFFAASYRVIAVDTRGHGKSPRGTAPFTISQFADDLMHLFNRLSIQKADVLGFSDGANIALLFALRYPDRVDRLILNGANLFPAGVKPYVQLPIELGYRAAKLFALRSEEAKHHAELLSLMVNDLNISPERLKTLQLPVLVITATRDLVRDSHSRLIAELLPNSVWKKIPGDHFAANKNPAVFNEIVNSFLKEEHPSKIRCIVLDLDGTTLNSSGHLTEHTRDTLERLIQKGIHVVIASGRPFDALPADILDVPGIEYAITSNGAAIYHLPSERCIHRTVLKRDSALGVLQVAEAYGCVLEAFVEGKAYAESVYVKDPVQYGASAASVRYIRRTREPIDHMRQFIMDHSNQLDSIALILKDASEYSRVCNAIEQAVPDVYITSAVDWLLEVSDIHCGKHNAIRYLLEILHLPIETVAAFGDGDNDADMLQEAAVGIAVSNASALCLQAADFVTKSNTEEGVPYGIQELLRL